MKMSLNSFKTWEVEKLELFTVGYEGVQIPAFIEALRDAGVEQIIDVRRIPLSRKKGFSKTPLKTTLNLAGFEYFHYKDLGCPQFIREHYRINKDWTWYEDHFESFLDKNEDLLWDLIRMSNVSPSCLLCFEAESAKCHRRLIAERIKKMVGEDMRIIDILPGKISSVRINQVDFRQSCFAF